MTKPHCKSGSSILATMVWLAVIFIGPPIPSALGATLTVPTLIGNHMVLQGGMSVPIWGTAASGAQVTVEFNGQDVSTTATANGRWLLNLTSMQASATPSTMKITSGAETLTYTDVQVGEVWGCSGQSNMEFSLGSSDGGAAAAADALSHNIRLFSERGNTTPSQVTWKVSDPTTAGGFSAVCYYFGLELSRHFDVPVGLIDCGKSGTPIEYWSPELVSRPVSTPRQPSLTIHPFGVDTPHVSVLRAGPHTTSWARGPLT